MRGGRGASSRPLPLRGRGRRSGGRHRLRSCFSDQDHGHDGRVPGAVAGRCRESRDAGGRGAAGVVGRPCRGDDGRPLHPSRRPARLSFRCSLRFSGGASASRGRLSPEVRAAGRAQVVASALAVAPSGPRGARAVYSDIGFMVLGELLARVGGRPLDVLFVERVAKPLGLGARFRRLSAGRASAPSVSARAGARDGLDIAPTGQTRRASRPPGRRDSGSLSPGRRRRPARSTMTTPGRWMAWPVTRACSGRRPMSRPSGRPSWRSAGGPGGWPRGYWAAALRRDTATPGSTRALGFDTRHPGDPRTGARPGGSSGWSCRAPSATRATLERASGSIAVGTWSSRCCTNRTAGPRGRGEGRIREFRPRFHDLASEASLPTLKTTMAREARGTDGMQLRTHHRTGPCGRAWPARGRARLEHSVVRRELGGSARPRRAARRGARWPGVRAPGQRRAASATSPRTAGRLRPWPRPGGLARRHARRGDARRGRAPAAGWATFSAASGAAAGRKRSGLGQRGRHGDPGDHRDGGAQRTGHSRADPPWA